MTEPRPAPKTPCPIHYQVVASWQVPPRPNTTVTAYRDQLDDWLRRNLPDDPTALYVTAYQPPASTTSEFEGTYGPLAVTEDADHDRPQHDVPVEGERL